MPGQRSEDQRRHEGDQRQAEHADLRAEQVDGQLLEREGVDVQAVGKIAVLAEARNQRQRRIGQVEHQIRQRNEIHQRTDVGTEGRHQCREQQRRDPAAPGDVVAVEEQCRATVVEQAELEDVLDEVGLDAQLAQQPEMPDREHGNWQEDQPALEETGQPENHHADVHQHFQRQRPQRAVDHIRIDVAGEYAGQFVARHQQDVLQVGPGAIGGQVATEAELRDQRPDDEDREQHRDDQRREDAQRPLDQKALRTAAGQPGRGDQVAAHDEEDTNGDRAALFVAGEQRQGFIAAATDQRIAMGEQHQSSGEEAQEIEIVFPGVKGTGGMHGLLLTVGSGWKLECTGSAMPVLPDRSPRALRSSFCFVCRRAPIQAASNDCAYPISLLCPER